MHRVAPPSRTSSIDASRRRIAFALIGSALLIVGGGAPLDATAAPDVALKLVAIVHPSVPEKKLDDDELRAVFLRSRLRWSNGVHVIPLNLAPGHPARLAFDRAVLGFDAEQASRFWIDSRIRSGTQPPHTAPSDTTLVRLVAALKGSIGYVSANLALEGVRSVARIEAGRVLPP